MNTIGISVISNRTHITLLAEDILYLSLSGRKTAIHITGDRIYETYTPIDELAKNLGSTFIRVDRCYLVSAKAIHDVTKTIDLINGESLDYARRRKREIVEQLRIERQKIGQTLERNDAPTSLRLPGMLWQLLHMAQIPSMQLIPVHSSEWSNWALQR